VSTDMTPAEQACAARWAARWIVRTVQDRGDWIDTQNITGDLAAALLRHADTLDPPAPPATPEKDESTRRPGDPSYDALWNERCLLIGKLMAADSERDKACTDRDMALRDRDAARATANQWRQDTEMARANADYWNRQCMHSVVLP
jgi:hypothetical protein